LLAVPVDVNGQREVVVVGTNLGDKNDAMHRLLLLLALGIPAAVLLASGLGWLVAGAALRPVERMRRDAAAASLSKAGPSIAVPPTGDELARLAGTLNELLVREREALEAEHRFLDEASHDLRTPLAVLKAELDLALSRPRDREELTDALKAAAQETDSLVRLAEDLLVLARSRHGPVALHRELVELTAFCADSAAPYGDAVTIEVQDASVSADPVRLRQAVRNLLDNAFRHGGGKEVRLVAAAGNGGFTISVSDGGVGFPDDRRGRLSRSSTSAGGLGLSIVAAVAEAHHGSAEAVVSESGGAEVRIFIPSR
jgi:signal transduction histidine kinase